MSDDGYVHDPDAFDADGERASDGVDDGERMPGGDEQGDRTTNDDERAETEAAVTDDSATDASLTGVHPAAVDRTFGLRGWILVGVIVLAFVVAPLSIYLMPPGGEVYIMSLVILPLFPALLLAVTAVWATTRP